MGNLICSGACLAVSAIVMYVGDASIYGAIVLAINVTAGVVNFGLFLDKIWKR